MVMDCWDVAEVCALLGAHLVVIIVVVVRTQTARSRSLPERSFVTVTKKTRALPRVDMTTWRTPVCARAVRLHDSLQSHVVTVQPNHRLLYLDNLSLPYADESLTTTPVDPPPTTSGCRVSISGHSDCSAATLSDVGSRGEMTSLGNVLQPPSLTSGRHIYVSDNSNRLAFVGRSGDGPLLRTSGRRVSISGHSEWSAGEATSTDTGSGGAAATPTRDVTRRPSSYVDDESRGRCESVVTSLPSPPAAAEDAETASATGPSMPVYRSTVAADVPRRCEPTHFHWVRPRFLPDPAFNPT